MLSRWSKNQPTGKLGGLGDDLDNWIVAGSDLLEDYNFTFEFVTNIGEPVGGIVGYKDENNFALVTMTHDRAPGEETGLVNGAPRTELIHVQDGQPRIAASFPFSYRIGEKNVVEITLRQRTAKQSDIVVRLNGNLVIDAVIDEVIGKIGFWSAGNNGYCSLVADGNDIREPICGDNYVVFDNAFQQSADVDGDSLNEALERVIGSDHRDVDTDGDFISDGVEVGPDKLDPVDTDGDGVFDFLDADSDGDCIADAIEAGRPNTVEPPVDSDFDGIYDARDTDSNNDDILDITHSNGVADDGSCDLTQFPADCDGDGERDYLDTDFSICTAVIESTVVASEFAVEGGAADCSAHPGNDNAKTAGLMLLVLAVLAITIRRQSC